MKVAITAKKVVMLVMTMALAVAMVACQAATPKPGEKGDPGTPGEQGPQGEPGTSDNAPPTASTISNEYLVLGSKAKRTATAKLGASASAGNYGSVEIDLSKYFTDAETPTLTYSATSSDKKIASLNTDATTNLITGGGSILTVTAAGVGTSTTETSAKATITVGAYDGVNEAATTTTFDVVVATSNTAPRVTLLEGIEDLINRDAVAEDLTADPPVLGVPALSNKLYKADGTITRTFRAAIDPGSIGTEKEMLSLRAVADKAAVVSVTDPVDAGGNAYSISITALKPTVPVGSSKPVMIFATDSFGAETLVTSFRVEVNTPPSVIRDLPDIVLSRSSTVTPLSLVDSGSALTVAPAAEALAIVPSADARRDVVYTLDKYFGFLELDKVLITGAAGSRMVTTPMANQGDTTCTYTTSPSQPTGRRERKAAAATATMPVAVTAIAADSVAAATMASVNNGRIATTVDVPGATGTPTPQAVQDAEIELLRTDLKDSESRPDTTTAATDHLMAMVVVDSGAKNLGANNAEAAGDTGINKDVEAAGLGTFMLTITCEDPDARVSGSARVTVRS